MKHAAVFLLAGLFVIVGCSPTATPDEPATVTDAPALPTTAIAITETAPPPVAVTSEATATNEGQAAPTSTEPAPAPSPETTDTPTAPQSVEADDPVIYGRTGEGAFFHGSPDAPVTLIDYSDFL